jgi:hypothetical protein
MNVQLNLVNCHGNDSQHLHQPKTIVLNQNLNDVANHLDIVVTSLQQKVFEAKGQGHVPDRFVKSSGDKKNEVIHKELVEKFGEDYEQKLRDRPDKGL